jgi:lysozyme
MLASMTRPRLSIVRCGSGSRRSRKAALVSIVYNVGPGRAASGKDPGRDGIVVLASGAPSTLLRNLSSLNFASTADQFLAWNKSGGQVLNALVRRRTAERSLFLTGVWK